MVKMLFISVISSFILTSASLAFDKKSKNKLPFHDANQKEIAKHVRVEFIHIVNILEQKKPPKFNRKNNTIKRSKSADEYRLETITDLKKAIEKYEAFPGINDWERAQMQSVQSQLAILEKRFDGAIALLTTIIKSDFITQKTRSEHYYTLYKLAFKQKKYQQAKDYLTNAYSLDHLLFAWDFANLAEIEFRDRKYDQGIKFLSSAITALDENKCAIQRHWMDILQDMKNNPESDNIIKLQAATDPWFYDIYPDQLEQMYIQKMANAPRNALKRGQAGFAHHTSIIDDKGKVVCTFLIKGGGEKVVTAMKRALIKSKYRPAKSDSVPVWSYGVELTSTVSRR